MDFTSMILSPAFDSFPAMALQICVGASVGAATGYCYFTALWWNVGLIDRGAIAGAVLLFATRFALLAAIFVLLAKFGALSLLAGAGGLLAARRLTIRKHGGAP
jgi:F1F0 ATPase subunit 2